MNDKYYMAQYLLMEAIRVNDLAKQSGDPVLMADAAVCVEESYETLKIEEFLTQTVYIETAH